MGTRHKYSLSTLQSFAETYFGIKKRVDGIVRAHKAAESSKFAEKQLPQAMNRIEQMWTAWLEQQKRNNAQGQSPELDIQRLKDSSLEFIEQNKNILDPEAALREKHLEARAEWIAMNLRFPQGNVQHVSDENKKAMRAKWDELPEEERKKFLDWAWKVLPGRTKKKYR